MTTRGAISVGQKPRMGVMAMIPRAGTIGGIIHHPGVTDTTIGANITSGMVRGRGFGTNSRGNRGGRGGEKMEIVVKIEWDKPKEQQWLNPDNISLALHAYCKNTKFKVRELKVKK